MTPWEVVQGIYQFLSCTSQGLDNGLCSRRTRHIDKLSQHRPFIMAKKLQIKKTSVPETAVCWLEDTVGECWSSMDKQTPNCTPHNVSFYLWLSLFGCSWSLIFLFHFVCFLLIQFIWFLLIIKSHFKITPKLVKLTGICSKCILKCYVCSFFFSTSQNSVTFYTFTHI